MQTVDGFPRRRRIDLMTPEETKIREAVLAVEALGAHPLLTETSVILQKARDKLADYVERDDPNREMTEAT